MDKQVNGIQDGFVEPVDSAREVWRAIALLKAYEKFRGEFVRAEELEVELDEALGSATNKQSQTR